MLLPVIHGHPPLWFVLLVVAMLATPHTSIMGNNDITSGGSDDVESYKDVGDGVKEFYTKTTDNLSFGRGSSSKEPEEMSDDDLQGSSLSYATHYYH